MNTKVVADVRIYDGMLQVRYGDIHMVDGEPYVTDYEKSAYGEAWVEIDEFTTMRGVPEETKSKTIARLQRELKNKSRVIKQLHLENDEKTWAIGALNEEIDRLKISLGKQKKKKRKKR